MGRGEHAAGAKWRNDAAIRETTSMYGLVTIPNRASARQILENNVSATNALNLDICASIIHFNQYGIGIPTLTNVSLAAAISGRLPGEELIRSGAISRAGYAYITACHFGLEYSAEGPAPQLLSGQANRLTRQHGTRADQIYSTDFFDVATQYRGWEQKPKIYVAGEPNAEKPIQKLVSTSLVANSQIVLTTRKALHLSQFYANCRHHLDIAINGLARRMPEISAKRVLTLPQFIIFLVMLLAFTGIGLFQPGLGFLALHILASVFYLSVTFMRAWMIYPSTAVIERCAPPKSITLPDDRQLPIYTIMVALYHEHGEVDALVASLSAIDWPKDRLQVLLVCEEDDARTIAKCEAHSGNEIIQTIICPAAQPKTKPKALNFALPLARGEFLVLYDAEDRPHSAQLKEAFEKFCREDEIACLQAPLVIHNDTQSWFTRMFAIEYTTQFNLILPVLEKWHSPFPLGGTSNHFRTRILKSVGGWDPFNVTEDADLGIRLARFGYRCGTIRSPTYEEAPPVFNVWLKQRTRWIKGWFQTLLVHMRHPVRLASELGMAKTILFSLGHKCDCHLSVGSSAVYRQRHLFCSNICR